MDDDVETMDHTARYAHKLNELGGLALGDLASGLYIVLGAEHEIVIRLHERLKMARTTIAILQEQLKDGEQ